MSAEENHLINQFILKIRLNDERKPPEILDAYIRSINRMHNNKVDWEMYYKVLTNLNSGKSSNKVEGKLGNNFTIEEWIEHFKNYDTDPSGVQLESIFSHFIEFYNDNIIIKKGDIFLSVNQSVQVYLSLESNLLEYICFNLLSSVVE